MRWLIGRLTQLVRVPRLHRGSREFESLIAHRAPIAQWMRAFRYGRKGREFESLWGCEPLIGINANIV